MLTGEGGVGDVDNEETVLWNYLASGRVCTRQGLGLAPHIVIDQHFLKRQRSNRLLSVLMTESTPEIFGLGVDEDVAVCITDGHIFEVLGSAGGAALLFERIQNSRTEYITRILLACPRPGIVAIDIPQTS